MVPVEWQWMTEEPVETCWLADVLWWAGLLVGWPMKWWGCWCWELEELADVYEWMEEHCIGDCAAVLTLCVDVLAHWKTGLCVCEWNDLLCNVAIEAWCVNQKGDVWWWKMMPKWWMNENDDVDDVMRMKDKNECDWNWLLWCMNELCGEECVQNMKNVPACWRMMKNAVMHVCVQMCVCDGLWCEKDCVWQTVWNVMLAAKGVVTSCKSCQPTLGVSRLMCSCWEIVADDEMMLTCQLMYHMQLPCG